VERDVCVYFVNDVKVRLSFDAARLAVKVGLRKKSLEDGWIARQRTAPRSLAKYLR